MKKMCLSIFCGLMLMILAVGAIPKAWAADVIQNGDWEGLTWELNETTGHLTISGNGPMAGLNYENGDAWLAYKSLIKTVTVENGVTTIGKEAFSFCKGLKSIELPTTLTEIEDSAFLCCTSLSEVEIPDGVQTIGYRAFSTVALTELEIPATVGFISGEVVSGCSGLRALKVAEGNERYHVAGNCIIETQSQTVIAGCRSSVIPTDGSVTVIGERAFYNCSGLKTMVLPDGIKEIDNHAFAGCYDLKKVCIPESVETIGFFVFLNSDHLTDVVYCGTEEQWRSISAALEFDDVGSYTVSFHEWNSGELIVAPTHMEEGERHLTCTLCNTTKTETAEKLKSHLYGEWSELNEEKHERSCVCGAVQSKKHRYDNQSDADCNSCGHIRAIETSSEPVLESEDATTDISGSESVTDGNGEIVGCGGTIACGIGWLLPLFLGAGALMKKED